MKITKEHVARVLRNAAKNPNIIQARDAYGELDSNNNGEACATTIIARFVDEYPDANGGMNASKLSNLFKRDFGVDVDTIIHWNDAEQLSLFQIADRIEAQDL